jgi:transketolase
MTIPDARVIELEEHANTIREDIIEMLVEAKSGHSAGPLDMADVFAALYFQTMQHRPSEPSWPDRDRLILSCGHICPVRYAAMARAGYFPVSELMTLRKFGSPLQGHPERTRLPGSETTSGPLGAGLAQACGLAYAARLDRKTWRTYCVTSDAEHQAGLHWEAVFFAGKYKLNNLTCIIDRNNIQIGGQTEEIMPLEPLREKYESFRWHVLEIDGNNMRRVVDAFEEVKAIREKPTVIIAYTIPGKGVDFMEGDYLWHGKPPTAQQGQVALEELRAVGGKLRSEHA